MRLLQGSMGAITPGARLTPVHRAHLQAAWPVDDGLKQRLRRCHRAARLSAVAAREDRAGAARQYGLERGCRGESAEGVGPEDEEERVVPGQGLCGTGAAAEDAREAAGAAGAPALLLM
jgi:hypothetical protein